MCILSSTVNEISKTRIYASADATNQRQLTVYSNFVSSPAQNTMVLPVPHAETVELLDFSDYSNFFDDLKKCFVRLPYRAEVDESLVPIYTVGSYHISIIHNLRELEQIDTTKFTITPHLVSFLREKYSTGNFGFLICALRPGNNGYHPLAYTHRLYKSGSLFIPTLHYHPDESGIDHDVQEADWDHLIYTPSTTLHTVGFRFNTNRPIQWEKLPAEYQWATNTAMDCWEKRGVWTNRDLVISHTVDPRGFADDCLVM